MPAMDKKQRKAKKREEKNKKMKMKQSAPALKEQSAENKKYGAIQLVVFLVIAIAGAAFILLNV